MVSVSVQHAESSEYCLVTENTTVCAEGEWLRREEHSEPKLEKGARFLTSHDKKAPKISASERRKIDVLKDLVIRFIIKKKKMNEACKAAGTDEAAIEIAIETALQELVERLRMRFRRQGSALPGEVLTWLEDELSDAANKRIQAGTDQDDVWPEPASEEEQDEESDEESFESSSDEVQICKDDGVMINVHAPIQLELLYSELILW